MSPKRTLYLAAALVVTALWVGPTLAATPGERSATIQLTSNVSDPDDQTFIGSGSGICSSGWADGQEITYLELVDVFKIRLTKWLHCDDGSGSFQIELSAGASPLGNPATSGGWIIVDGTGDYATAVGGGTMTAKLRSPNDVLVVDAMIGMITK